MTPLKLLAVFAHPDDESFPVGGTLAKYAAEGVEVMIVSATKGEAGIKGLGVAETAAIHESELRRAAAELGAREVRFLGYLDPRGGEVSLPRVVRARSFAPVVRKRSRAGPLCRYEQDPLNTVNCDPARPDPPEMKSPGYQAAPNQLGLGARAGRRLSDRPRSEPHKLD